MRERTQPHPQPDTRRSDTIPSRGTTVTRPDVRQGTSRDDMRRDTQRPSRASGSAGNLRIV